MTIDVVRLSSPDLFAPNKSLLFDIERARRLGKDFSPVAAISYVANRTSAVEKLEVLMEVCARKVARVLYANLDLRGYSAALFVADGTWQEPSPVLRYKKLWKRRNDVIGAIRPHRMSDEIAFESNEGIRYAGFVFVEQDQFVQAAEIVRKDWACALLMSQRHEIGTKEEIQATFAAAFPPIHGVESTSIDWLRFSLRCCALGDIIVRASASFDDPDAAIDLIFNPTLIASDAL